MALVADYFIGGIDLIVREEEKITACSNSFFFFPYNPLKRSIQVSSKIEGLMARLKHFGYLKNALAYRF
jgi:hypothetical protein